MMTWISSEDCKPFASAFSVRIRGLPPYLFYFLFYFMAIIKVAGTAKDQKVYLCLSRKPEGSLQTHEYEHRNQAGELKEFRKKLPNNELKGLTINRVKIDKYENTNGVSYPVTLFVTHRT